MGICFRRMFGIIHEQDRRRVASSLPMKKAIFRFRNILSECIALVVKDNMVVSVPQM